MCKKSVTTIECLTTTPYTNIINTTKPRKQDEQSTRQTNPRPHQSIRASPEERKGHHKAIQPRGYSGPQASTRNNRG